MPAALAAYVLAAESFLDPDAAMGTLLAILSFQKVLKLVVLLRPFVRRLVLLTGLADVKEYLALQAVVLATHLALEFKVRVALLEGNEVAPFGRTVHQVFILLGCTV